MPKFNLPKPKPTKNADAKSPAISGDEWTWRRRLSIPINGAIAAGLEIGDEAQIELRGTVVGLSMNKSEASDSCTLEIDLDTVMSEQGPEEMDQDDYENYRKNGGGKK